LGLFKRRKALTATADAAAAIRDPGYNAYPILGGGAASQRIQNAFNRAQSANYGWMYANSPAVRTVIDVIVRNVGQLELRLYEEVDEAERQPRPDHPAALSMRYPNETTTSDSLVRALFKDKLIYDNAYALLTPAAGGQISLMRIPAYMVEVMGPSLFDVGVYRVWPQGAWTTAGTWGGFGTPVDFTPDQILHWHGEHPLDPRIGLSRMDTLRDVVAEDAALQQATVELANSGLQQPMAILRPVDAGDWDGQTVRSFEEDMAARMRRRNQRPIVLEEGMTMQPIGMSPNDAQMLEVRRWAVERMATAYGVPLAVVGLGTGRAENLADAQAQFYTDTLLPYCQDFTKMLDQRLLVRAYNWTAGVFEFNFDEKLMGNDRLRAFVSAVGAPIMLRNEARAKLNLPPVDGGDEIITPLNVIEGDNPKPSTDVMGPQDPNAPPQDGSYRVGQGSADTLPKALTKSEGALPQFHPRRKADIERQHRHIDAFQAVVQRHFNRLERSLRAKAVSDGSNTDWQRWDREFSDDLNKSLNRIVETEGTLYAMKLGGHDFDMRRVEHYLKAMAEGAAGAINDTIRQEITDLGLDEALSRAPQHVQSAGTSLGAKSTIWAREEAARQSGTYEQRVKVWVADTDRHAEFDGDTVPIGEDWPAGFAPGGAPNCACTAVIQ
jgi:HK97 family phage portal protein